MEVSSGATVLMCSRSAELEQQCARWHPSGVRLHAVRDEQQAFERLLLDDDLAIVYVDSRWPGVELDAFVSRSRRLVTSRGSHAPIVVVAAAGHDPAESRSVLRALEAGADAVVSPARSVPAESSQGLLPVAARPPVTEVLIEWLPEPESGRRGPAGEFAGSSTSDTSGAGGPSALAPIVSHLERNLREADECRAVGDRTVALRLGCDVTQLFAPLGRIAKGLRNSGMPDSGRWQARLREAAYRLPA